MEHDYVEYEIDVKNGQVVGCKLAGEGRQVEPLTEPVVVFLPVGSEPPHPGFLRIAQRIKRAFLRLGR